MSEKLLKLLLSELSTIRVHCKKCRSNATIELPVDRIDRLFDKWECPICNEPFRKDKVDSANYLTMLAKAIEGIKEAADKVEIAFVVDFGCGEEDIR
jgi:hypothetical protein